MKIAIICPAPPGARTGNRVTAERWRSILTGLGHAVRIVHDADPGRADLLVALHATRSADAIARFRAHAPCSPVIVSLVGTDLYDDLPRIRWTLSSLETAWKIVVLHPHAELDLPSRFRSRTRVILQSARAPRVTRPRSPRFFDVAMVAHLRRVKDPFRAEEASRNLPPGSRLRVRHVGGAIEPGLDREARRRAGLNPRYRWLGARPGGETRRLIARAHLLALTSHNEGGAIVISEAIVSGVPVIASHIPCTVGLLGRDYPGLFPAGDTGALRELLLRAESEPSFLRALAKWCRGRRPLFSPVRERRSWRALLDELRPPSRPSCMGTGRERRIE